MRLAHHGISASALAGQHTSSEYLALWGPIQSLKVRMPVSVWRKGSLQADYRENELSECFQNSPPVG